MTKLLKIQYETEIILHNAKLYIQTHIHKGLLSIMT